MMQMGNGAKRHLSLQCSLDLTTTTLGYEGRSHGIYRIANLSLRKLVPPSLVKSRGFTSRAQKKKKTKKKEGGIENQGSAKCFPRTGCDRVKDITLLEIMI